MTGYVWLDWLSVQFWSQDTVSVHRPGFYAERFLNFMSDKIFKKIPSCKLTLWQSKILWIPATMLWGKEFLGTIKAAWRWRSSTVNCKVVVLIFVCLLTNSFSKKPRAPITFVRKKHSVSNWEPRILLITRFFTAQWTYLKWKGLTESLELLWPVW